MLGKHVINVSFLVTVTLSHANVLKLTETLIYAVLFTKAVVWCFVDCSTLIPKLGTIHYLHTYIVSVQYTI